tara:strand:+ start:657 stop:914 length:258 start_codon:yes stop_codon:yes gene_type:complete
MSKPKVCVICKGGIEQKKTPEGKVYWDSGENAEPYAEGRCCGSCNDIFVIPARMEDMMKAAAMRARREKSRQLQGRLPGLPNDER